MKKMCVRMKFVSGKMVWIIIAAVFLLGLICIPSTATASENLNLGMVESSPSKIIKQFQPLLDYLNTKGISTGKIIVTKTLPQMIKKFESGEVDFMFESPYGALQLMDKIGAVPILIREKKGVKEYNSVIFVPKDSPIQNLSDLKGKVIAFEDPLSTSSCLLPKKILTQEGLELIESRKPVPGKVAYYFSKDDDNTIVQVKAGKRASAGGIKKSSVDSDPAFRILQPESAYVPRHVVLIRKGMPYDQLKKVLLKMIDDSSAANVLKTIKTPTGFSEFSGDPVKIMNTTVRQAMGL